MEIGDLIEEGENWEARLFFFETEGRRVSGQITLPKGGEGLPIVVMLRGYVDKEIYFTGLGTRKAAAFFAESGLVALAPDFLGFGQSEEESEDILLNRFKRPETVLSLLASLVNLNQALEEAGVGVRVNPERVFLWGHSNGGQIALSVLEILGREMPTTLWAPVSKDFPECILQYASELEDEGRMVIEAVEKFEKNHDPGKFSVGSFWGWIEAPIQVHQGTADSYIDEEDTAKLVSNLEFLGKNVFYYEYQGDDHNLSKNWDEVVKRDLEFFRKYF